VETAGLSYKTRKETEIKFLLPLGTAKERTEERVEREEAGKFTVAKMSRNFIS
jgi:hypothetical protein